MVYLGRQSRRVDGHGCPRSCVGKKWWVDMLVYICLYMCAIYICGCYIVVVGGKSLKLRWMKICMCFKESWAWSGLVCPCCLLSASTWRACSRMPHPGMLLNHAAKVSPRSCQVAGKPGSVCQWRSLMEVIICWAVCALRSRSLSSFLLVLERCLFCL